MSLETKTVPELLQEADLHESGDRKPVRLLACGCPEEVTKIIHWLHMKGFAQVGEWSPPLPSTKDGEIIRILTRYYGSTQVD